MDKKIKCVHCDNEILVDGVSTKQCTCGSIVVTNGVITEGAIGVDWVDVSPMLLNE